MQATATQVKQPWEMNQDEKSKLWLALIAKLAITPLPTRGEPRTADVGEFMLMHIGEKGEVGFKHIDTRNYVFLLPDGEEFELYVPVTPEPFMRGQFDKS